MRKKSFAKVNIYLKIIGIRDNYHLIESRFMIVNSLYDTLYFKKREDVNSDFCLTGNFSCQTKDNIIYKAYQKLLQLDNVSKKVKDFFKYYEVVVEKRIPEFAGLGGGSSNAAAFLQLTNEVLKLKIDNSTLVQMGSLLGADVTFFLNNFDSANVRGIGEKVESFKEKALDFEIFTPKIKCETGKVYKKYREIILQNYDNIIKKNVELSDKLSSLTSHEILESFKPEELNDLFTPALKLYPKLYDFTDKGFFSGSGSSFFKELK